MDKSDQSEWIPIRIKRTTHAALLRVRERLMRDEGNARVQEAITVDRFGLSMNSVVVELIRRDESHAERSRRSRAKRAR